MRKQLDYAFKLYKQGEIDGMIFHCTPLCNKNLAAVEYAKKWIAEHAGEKAGGVKHNSTKPNYITNTGGGLCYLSETAMPLKGMNWILPPPGVRS